MTDFGQRINLIGSFDCLLAVLVKMTIFEKWSFWVILAKFGEPNLVKLAKSARRILAIL